MNQLLSPGQTVQAINSGQPCKVDKFLGGGGQGEVYRAAWAGGSYALKWYFPHTATPEQREALQRLISEHRPPSDQFLWPLDFVEARGVAGYGYLMRLREPRYKSLVDLVAGRIDPTFRVIVTSDCVKHSASDRRSLDLRNILAACMGSNLHPRVQFYYSPDLPPD